MFCPTQFSLGDLWVSCHIISFVQLLPQCSGIPRDGSVHVTLVTVKQAELSAPSTDIRCMLLSGSTKCSLWGFLARTRKIPVLIGSEYSPCERRISLSLTRCCVWVAGMRVFLFSSTIDLLISLTGVFLLFLYLWRRYDHRTFTVVKFPEDKTCIHITLSSLKTNKNKKRHWNKNIYCKGTKTNGVACASEVYCCVSSNCSWRTCLLAISHQSCAATSWHPTSVFILVLVLEFPLTGRFHTPYMEKLVLKKDFFPLVLWILFLVRLRVAICLLESPDPKG